MRSGLSTIQQTLTPEAAAVLNQSISEAGRRNHGQTTPLHVASTLLSSPAGFLRQACIRSHPNSSHPLQCRALELCFSVALERLPSAVSMVVTEPPISNALMATLKRAQAHQRRGCPEQQQQPLLAVKVELEQLIISILDDPSVSRVMREAGFSSPAVKTALTAASAGSTNSTDSLPATTSVFVPRNSYNSYTNSRLQQENHQKSGSTFIPSSSPINLYQNPRLQQEKQVNPRSNQSSDQRNDDVKRVLEIMTKPKRRNPILVGESEPETIRLEIIRRIETGPFGIEKPKSLNNVEVISIGKEFESMSDKSKIPTRIKELCNQIDKKIANSDSSKDIIIDVADLKWLVDQPPISSIGRESVSEMAKLVGKFTGKVWLIGTATCETYLRCQVYHQSMEIDWDLQAVPITSRSSIPNMFPRMGTNGVLGSSIQSMNLEPNRNVPICAKCSSDYEQELAKLKESEKPIEPVKNNLPQWMQNAKPKDQSNIKDKEVVLKQKIQDLQKKWRDECFRIHRNRNPSSRFDRVDRVSPMVVPMIGSYKPNMLLRQSQPQGQPGQPRRLQPAGILPEGLQPVQAPRLEAPRSPVRTDLVLGPKKPSETTGSKEDQDLTVKDLLGCISSEPQKGKFANSEDAEYFKRLLKSLMKKAWWQPEAASAIATTITQSKVDTGSRGSVWLLFAGPDRVGKKKMASVISEHVNGTNPITIALGSRRDVEETDTGFRGKTVLDRIVDAVRRNPSSVIVLSDIDEADTLVRGSIKRAMERGRLTDFHGREISLGNVIFILTGNWSTGDIDEHQAEEQRLRSLACRDWQLRLAVCNKRYKRRADWLSEKNNSRKQRKELGLDLSLDLNLAIDYEEDRTDDSMNSSNLTVDQEEESQQFAVTCIPRELSGPSDGTVVFKPVNFGNIRREIEKTVTNAFSAIVDEKVTIEVDEGAVENIMGGLWFGGISLEEWAEQVLVPSMRQVNARLPNPGANMVVRLESDCDSVRVTGGDGDDWLPGKIAVVNDGV